MRLPGHRVKPAEGAGVLRRVPDAAVGSRRHVVRSGTGWDGIGLHQVLVAARRDRRCGGQEQCQQRRGARRIWRVVSHRERLAQGISCDLILSENRRGGIIGTYCSEDGTS